MNIKSLQDGGDLSRIVIIFIFFPSVLQPTLPLVELTQLRHSNRNCYNRMDSIRVEPLSLAAFDFLVEF